MAHDSAIHVSRGRIWFAGLGGAIAWTLHLLIAYAIAEFGCVGGLGHRSFLGITAVSWMAIVLSVVMAAVALAATAVAWRMGRSFPPAPADGDFEDAGAFMSYAGLLTSGIFALIIIVESIPIFFYLQHC